MDGGPVITAQVNGTARELRPGTTVADLLVELEVDARLVAIELNGTIVRRGSYESRRLEDGDRVEIVRFVQGG